MLSGAPADNPIGSRDGVMQSCEQACWGVGQHLNCCERSREHQTANTATASRFTEQAQLQHALAALPHLQAMIQHLLKAKQYWQS